VFTSRPADHRIIALRDNLVALLNHEGSREHLDGVVAVCHALALTHVRTKASAWKMMDFHGLSPSDLAYDCIADLFRQDEQGFLPELARYFAPLDLDNADSAEALVHLRRLVFARVNITLSQLIAETDSFFARTMRNCRNAVAASDKFTEIERFGDLLLVPTGCDPLWHMPPPSDEALGRLIGNNVAASDSMPAFMARIHNDMCAQNAHCRVIPLLLFIAQIKALSEHRHRIAQSDIAPEQIDESAVRDLVANARAATARKFQSAYVANGKVSAEEFSSYLNAIEAALMQKIFSGDGEDPSLFASLQKEIAGLSEQQYRSVHRSRVEYMARFMHGRIAEHMRKS
jgi:hypothetical protein